MEIDSIPFSYLDIEDTDEFGRFIRDTLTTSHPDDPWIQEVVVDLEAPLGLTQEAIGSSRKLEITKAIRTADRLLDQAFSGFVKVITGYELSPVAEESEAARVLLPILEKNDKYLYKRGYVEQSAKFTSLLADLDGEPANTALQDLTLIPWKSALNGRFTTLEDLRQDRSNMLATAETPTDKLAKTELQDAIKLVLSDLDTLRRRNKVPGLAATVKLIETRVREIETAARARMTRKKSKGGNTDQHPTK